MAFWVHVEKGYIIFTVYFSSFKSLESLARLLKKVLKSCETFRIQDFANASCEISKRNWLFFYISHRPNKNQHQQYQIQIFHPTMYFWILQPWNCKSVNPFFTTLVWRKEKGVCINFTKIASNEVVTQKFDCHQQLSSTKVCLWKKWTIFFHFCDNQTFGWRFHLT